jgi:hypothetical protein
MDVKSGNWDKLITMVPEASACENNIWLRKYNTPCSVQNTACLYARGCRDEIWEGGEIVFFPHRQLGTCGVWGLGQQVSGFLFKNGIVFIRGELTA